jgi:RecA-family ATPase
MVAAKMSRSHPEDIDRTPSAGLVDQSRQSLVDLDSPPPSKLALPAEDASPVVKLVRLADASEPEPREFVIDGLVPAGAPTFLYGTGGVGKSQLALYFAICVAAAAAPP